MRLMVVVNPRSGHHQEWRPVMDEVFGAAGIGWDVRETQKGGDAHRFAAEAVQAGYDAVAVFGGDGTVMEVASGVANSEVPMAILPGGTANVMSKELGIPPLLHDACSVLCGQYAVRTVDMGRVGKRVFALRVAVGLEAQMVEKADPTLKERLGIVAYGVTALQELANPTVAKYHLKIDGQAVDTEGLSVMVANSGHLGLAGLRLLPEHAVADGKLDVVVLRAKGLAEVAGVALSVLIGKTQDEQNLLLWQAKRVTIQAEPAQTVQVDGEIIGETPVTVEVLPRALKVIVPVSGIPEGEPAEPLGAASSDALQHE